MLKQWLYFINGSGSLGRVIDVTHKSVTCKDGIITVRKEKIDVSLIFSTCMMICQDTASGFYYVTADTFRNRLGEWDNFDLTLRPLMYDIEAQFNLDIERARTRFI